MTPNGPYRAVAYLRQSERRPGEDERTSLSLNGQEDAFRRWCAAHDAVPVAVVRDHDLRGADPGRPGLRELLDVAERERVDLVWVVSLSRFARDHILQELVWRDLQQRGVQSLISEVESGTEDDFIRGLHGLIHARSKKEQSTHLRNAFTTRARSGAFPVGLAPFGYRRPHTVTVVRANGTSYQRQTGTPEIDPEAAATVREIYRRFVAGEALTSIAVSLRDEVPNVRGGTWRHRHLQRIIENPIYCGLIAHRGAIVAEAPQWAIVDRATWDAAQLRLRRAPTVRQRSDRDRPWLDGLVRHSCGRMMRSFGANGSRDHLTWRCNGHSDQTCTETRTSIMDWILSAAVKEVLRRDLGALRSPVQAEQWAIDRAGGADASANQRRLEKRELAAHQRWRRNHERFSDGKLPPAVMDQEDARLEAELAELATERELLPRAPDPVQIARLHGRLRSVADAIAAMTDQELRGLLADLGTVVVNETGVRIRYLPELEPLIAGAELPVPRGRGWAKRV